MPKVSRITSKNAVALLLTLLLLPPAFNLGGAAQTLRDLRQQNDGQKRRKLAPDLAETLAWAEKENNDSGAENYPTLGQLRQGKLPDKKSLPGAWSQSAPTSSSHLQKTERVIVNLNGLATDITLKSCLLKLDGRLQQVHPKLGLATVELPLDRVRELAAEPEIDYVSPDRPIMAFGHIEATTGAEQARLLALTKGIIVDGNGIGLAIIDSGVDSNHKLLRTSSGHPGIVSATDLITADARTDRYGHGTFVASVAVGGDTLNNGAYEGIAPGANLITLKVLNDEGVGLTSSLISALDWCIYNRTKYNIRVINLSIGTVAKDSYRNDPLCLAARRAHAAGILVVAAAGNDGKDRFGHKLYGGIHSPGIDPTVLTVGAVNTFDTDRRSDDQVATYSSRGPTRGYYGDANGVKHYDNLLKPDLVAPGNRIIGASSRNPDGKDDFNNLVQANPTLAIKPTKKIEERVMYLSGTSVAAPIVAGAAALLFEVNANLTPNLVKAILMYSAQPISGFNTLEQGAGLLNVDGAVRLARLVKSNPTTLATGSLMLTGAMPAAQSSFIAKETCDWGQSVITNYCFLYGSNLMTFWQGVYGRKLELADATKVVNGSIRQAPGLLASGVLNSGGVVCAEGGSMGDDQLIANGVVFADGITYASGVVFADGRIMADPFRTSTTLVKAKVVVPGD